MVVGAEQKLLLTARRAGALRDANAVEVLASSAGGPQRLPAPLSVLPQRAERVHAHRAAGRNPRGQHGHGEEQ
jgi:hypothetical protein